jgi:chromosome partitioning protein
MVSMLDEIGVPIAKSRIGNRVAFAAAMSEGSGVTEGGGGRAAEEITALAKEILRRVKG